MSVLTMDELYNIMFYLTTRDVLHCMQACQYWKEALSHKYFWKYFVRKRFDLQVKTNIKELENPLSRWADPMACSRGRLFRDEDTYVLRPFPTTWNCGVVVPFGLDLTLFDTKQLQGLSRSLEILAYMKDGIEELGLQAGKECGADSTSYGLPVVLMPWDGDGLPSDLAIFEDIFAFHPEIVKDICEETGIETREFSENIYFHSELDHDPDKEDEMCLNSIFGRHWSRLTGTEKTYDYEKELTFFTWLQDIMVPSKHCSVGDEIIRPVVDFFVTNLAPGWVGGVLTSQYLD